MELRRQFDLPQEDSLFLEECGYQWETIIDGAHWVLLHGFSSMHSGYNHQTVTAAIRIETGYPKATLDMVYFYPALARNDGQSIPCDTGHSGNRRQDVPEMVAPLHQQKSVDHRRA